MFLKALQIFLTQFLVHVQLLWYAFGRHIFVLSTWHEILGLNLIKKLAIRGEIKKEEGTAFAYSSRRISILRA
jgi:hypothetical protein